MIQSMTMLLGLWILALSTVWTPVHAAKVDVQVNYTYTCFFDVNIGRAEAFDRIDSAGLSYLEAEIENAEVDVTVLNFTSETLSACAPLVLQADENLGICVEALGSVWINIDEDIEYNLVEKLSVVKVQNFIDEFNVDNENDIHVGYTSPIPLKFTMVLELDGVRTELTPGDAARLRAELLSTLRPILAEGEPPFDLTDVKIVAQQLQVEQESRRRRAAVKFLPQVEQEVAPADSSSTHRRELQTISGVHTEVILVGNCAIVEGVDNCEPQLVQQRAKSAVTDESATILQNLQEETSIRDYFDRVDGFGVNAASDSLITINVTEILAETNDIPSLEEFSNDTTDEEEAPWWIWVLVGGVAGVFAVGSIWASRAIQERNREAILRQAFEENHRQSMAGVSRSMMSKGGNSDHSNGMGGSGTSQPQTDFDDEPDSAEPESTPRGSTAATEDGSSDNVATTVVSTTGVGAVEVTSLMSDDHSTDTPASNAVPVATTVMASDIPSAAEEIPDTQSPPNGSATGKLVVSAPKEP